MSSRWRPTAGMIAAAFCLAAAPMSMGPRPDFKLVAGSYPIAVQDYCFPSGYRVSVRRDKRRPLVAMTAVVDRGSAADPEGREGGAHLVEHLWFRARPDGGAPVWDRLTRVGARFNAYTVPDVTTYQTVAPIGALNELLDLEAHRLADPLQGTTDADIAIERSIIEAELVGHQGLRMDGALAALSSDLFPKGHPYQHMSAAGIASLSRAELEVVTANYRPQDTTLMIVGDVAPETVLARVQARFPEALLYGEGEGRDPEQPCAPRLSEAVSSAPSPASTALRTIEAEGEAPVLLVGWTLPGAFREDQSRLELASLATGHAVEEAVIVLHGIGRSDVRCGFQPMRESSAMVCAVQLPRRVKVERVVRAVEQGLEWSGHDRYGGFDRGVQLTSLHRRGDIFRAIELGTSPLNDIANDAVLYNHFVGEPVYYSRALESLDDVDGAAIQELARRWLSKGRMARVLFQPTGAADAAEVLEVPELPGNPGNNAPVGDAAVTVEGLRHALRVELEALASAGAEGDIAARAVGPELRELRHFTLDNGLEVRVLPFGEIPVTNALIRFEGGQAMETRPGLNEQSWLAWRYSSEPIGQSADRAASGIGGEVTTANDLGSRSFQIRGNAGNLDAQLFILRALVDAPVADRDAKSYWNLLYWWWRLDLLRDPDAWMSGRRYAALYPGHPLATLDPPERMGGRRSEAHGGGAPGAGALQRLEHTQGEAGALADLRGRAGRGLGDLLSGCGRRRRQRDGAAGVGLRARPGGDGGGGRAAGALRGRDGLGRAPQRVRRQLHAAGAASRRAGRGAHDPGAGRRAPGRRRRRRRRALGGHRPDRPGGLPAGAL